MVVSVSNATHGRYVPIYFAFTSTVAAVIAAAAIFFREPRWKARVLGAGIGAWAAIIFVPFFLYPDNLGAVIGWSILVVIGASVAVEQTQGLLPGRDLAIQLLIGAAVCGAVVVGLGVVVVVVSVVTTLPGNF